VGQTAFSAAAARPRIDSGYKHEKNDAALVKVFDQQGAP
jgi:hypothetical protein